LVRILVVAAHPDDAEIFAGGLLARHGRLGNPVKIVSVTDGRAGHHRIAPHELVRIRRAEAQAAGERIGAEYVTWDFPDGLLTPSIEVRQAIIREVRSFKPDLVLTHRPYDYHPDHRAVGTAVQDASYLVTVPHICEDSSALRHDPVVAYMTDLFTRPCPLRTDVVLDVSDQFDTVVQMTACHQSQVFEWLPYHDGLEVPQSYEARLEWLADWLSQLHRKRRQHFAADLVSRGLPLDDQLKVEVFEVSEYAGQADDQRTRELFPGML
jgi:LmbE family N-acetylglucosaminyl deacetylase